MGSLICGSLLSLWVLQQTFVPTFSWLAKGMPRSCLEIVGESGFQGSVFSRINVNASDCRKRRSLRSQHRSVKNCSCKKSKSASLHNVHQQLVDAALGWRKKEKEVHRSTILAILLVQIFRRCKSTVKASAIPRCSSENKRGKFTNTWFIQVELRAACLAGPTPLKLVHKKMELCLWIQQNISICSQYMLKGKHTCFTTQLSKIYNDKEVEDGHEPTAGHSKSHWFSYNTNWAVVDTYPESAWVLFHTDCLDCQNSLFLGQWLPEQRPEPKGFQHIFHFWCVR